METKNNIPGLVLVDCSGTHTRVYAVPDNVYLSANTNVLIDIGGNEHSGICVTDTVYPDDDTYNFLCKVLCSPDGFPYVSGRFTVQRFSIGG